MFVLIHAYMICVARTKPQFCPDLQHNFNVLKKKKQKKQGKLLIYCRESGAGFSYMFLSKKYENLLAGLHIGAGERRILPELLHLQIKTFSEV